MTKLPKSIVWTAGLLLCLAGCNRPATGPPTGAPSARTLDSPEVHSAWIAATGDGMFPEAQNSGKGSSMKVAEWLPSSQGVCAIMADGDGKQAQTIVAADLRGAAADLHYWRLGGYFAVYGEGPSMKEAKSQTPGGEARPCTLLKQLDTYLERNGRTREKRFFDAIDSAVGR